MAKRKTSSRKKKKNNSFLKFLIIVIILALLSFAASHFILQTDNEVINTITKTENKTEEQKKPKSTAIKHALDGTWASYNDGAMLTITGSQFSIELPSVESTVVATGKILFEKNQVTFIYNNGSACGNKPGVYQFTIEGEDVTFAKIRDNCESRAEQIIATWFKV